MRVSRSAAAGVSATFLAVYTARAAAGRDTQKVLPWGPLDSTVRDPPCASAIHFAIVSPSPAPPARRDGSSCTKRSKMRA